MPTRPASILQAGSLLLSGRPLCADLCCRSFLCVCPDRGSGADGGPRHRAVHDGRGWPQGPGHEGESRSTQPTAAAPPNSLQQPQPRACSTRLCRASLCPRFVPAPLRRQLNPVVGYFDPLNLAEGEFWGDSTEATIGFLREARRAAAPPAEPPASGSGREPRLCRLRLTPPACRAAVGDQARQNRHVRLCRLHRAREWHPLAVEGPVGEHPDRRLAAGLRPASKLAPCGAPPSRAADPGSRRAPCAPPQEMWDLTPEAAKWQIILTIGFFEFWCGAPPSRLPGKQPRP